MKDYATEPATRDELLGMCKYYKGEKTNPYNEDKKTTGYDNIRAKVWHFEMLLYTNLHTDKTPFTALHYLEYIEHYPEYEINGNMPLCLKDCILSAYLHYNELPSPEEFKTFLKGWKSKTL